MSAREDLAAAASSVEGITCAPYYVQDPSPGRAWVRLDRIDFPNRFGGVAHWSVVVVLPQDMATAEQYLEQKLPGLREALGPHLAITSAVPQRIDLPTHGVVPCVFLNGHREAD